jgi:hypothetical protein
MLGNHNMKIVINKILNSTHLLGGLLSIFKEGQIINQAFPPEVYENIFEKLAKTGQEYV